MFRTCVRGNTGGTNKKKTCETTITIISQFKRQLLLLISQSVSFVNENATINLAGLPISRRGHAGNIRKIINAVLGELTRIELSIFADFGVSSDNAMVKSFDSVVCHSY